MRRAGFKSRAPTAPARDPDRVRSTPTVTPGAWRAPEQVITGASRVQKAALVRSETYRRLVASLPCIACGIQGYSQAAHLPPEAKAMKQSDLLTFPLCCTRVGVHGCHQDYDKYRLFPRAAAMTAGRAWAADTQRRLLAMGLVPPYLMQPISEALQGSTQRQPKEQPKD
jgi:hypothetical protein